MELKSSKNVFVGYPVKCLILVASSFEMFFWTLLKPSFIDSQEFRVMLWKSSYRCSAAGKNLILAQHYYQYVTLWWLLQIFTIRYLMYQCVPHSGKSLQLYVLLTLCNLTTCYNNFLIRVIVVAHHYQRESLNLPAIGHLPVQSQQ